MKNFIALCSWLLLLAIVGCAALLRAQSPTGFWRAEDSMDELQYVITVGGAWQTCAAVGKASDGWFYIDIVRPRIEEKIQSLEFNDLDAAKLFAERQCR